MTRLFSPFFALASVGLLSACAEFTNPFSGPGSQSEPAPVVVEDPEAPLEPLTVPAPVEPVAVEVFLLLVPPQALSAALAEKRVE